VLILRKGVAFLSAEIPLVYEALTKALVTSALALSLLGDCQPLRENAALSGVLSDAIAALCDEATQWAVMLCAELYFVGFIVARRRLLRGGATKPDRNQGLSIKEGAIRLSELWMAGLLAPAAIVYALHYVEAAKSTHALTLLGAAVLGQAAGYWEGRRRNAEGRSGGSPKSNVQSRFPKVQSRLRAQSSMH
jgi:hypothetical protein